MIHLLVASQLWGFVEGVVVRWRKLLGAVGNSLDIVVLHNYCVGDCTGNEKGADKLN